MNCFYYGRYCMNKADGKAEINGKVVDLCASCAHEESDQVDGNVEIVESL